jgi:hypothetical protein
VKRDNRKMVKVKKFMKLEKPTHGWYSHEDQEVHGLRFCVFYSDNTIALFGVKGEETEIATYMSRFGTRIAELTDAKMKIEIDKYISPGPRPCIFCEGTGKLIIPKFDPLKAKEELDKVFVPPT